MRIEHIKKTVGRILYPRYYGRLVCRAKSRYSSIRVVDKKGFRFLIFDDPSFRGKYPEEVFQGCLNLKDPVNTRIPYVEYLHHCFRICPSIKSVFMIGLGSGLIPLQFLNRYPLEEFHVAEIDSEVVRMAARYFSLPRDPRLQIFIQEGREYLEKCDRSYDLIILDAFFARSLPFPLLTRQFFSLAKRRLGRGGILSININGALEGQKSRLFHSFYNTLQQEFHSICFFAHRPQTPEVIQNIVIHACRGLNLAAKMQDLLEFNYYDHGGHLKNLCCSGICAEDAPVFDDSQGHKTLDLYDFSLPHH